MGGMRKGFVLLIGRGNVSDLVIYDLVFRYIGHYDNFTKYVIILSNTK